MEILLKFFKDEDKIYLCNDFLRWRYCHRWCIYCGYI